MAWKGTKNHDQNKERRVSVTIVDGHSNKCLYYYRVLAIINIISSWPAWVEAEQRLPAFHKQYPDVSRIEITRLNYSSLVMPPHEITTLPKRDMMHQVRKVVKAR